MNRLTCAHLFDESIETKDIEYSLSNLRKGIKNWFPNDRKEVEKIQNDWILLETKTKIPSKLKKKNPGTGIISQVFKLQKDTGIAVIENVQLSA